jgi:hypothetical protein
MEYYILSQSQNVIYSLRPKMTDTRIKEVKQIGAQKMRRDMYRDVLESESYIKK